jgi:hypothetical protein
MVSGTMPIWPRTNPSANPVQVDEATYHLSIPRAFAAAASTQGKLVVAGGMTGFQPSSLTANFTTRVDIFDLTTRVRTTTQMPGPPRGTTTVRENNRRPSHAYRLQAL